MPCSAARRSSRGSAGGRRRGPPPLDAESARPAPRLGATGSPRGWQDAARSGGENAAGADGARTRSWRPTAPSRATGRRPCASVTPRSRSWRGSWLSRPGTVSTLDGRARATVVAGFVLVAALVLVGRGGAAAGPVVVLAPGHDRYANPQSEPIGPGSPVRKIKDGGGTR